MELAGAGEARQRCHAVADSISLWRAGIAGDTVMHMCDIGVMLVFYVLLSLVNRNLRARFDPLRMTCIALGYSIVRSGYLPKLLGMGMQLAGVCYIISSFVPVLFPELAPRLFPAILLPPFIAELSTALWLLVKGVNLSKWHDRQGAIAGV